MQREVALIFIYSAIVSTLVPLLCFFIYRKDQPRQNVILSISLAISFAFDLVGWALAKIYHENAVSNNLYFMVAFPAIMWFYHETLVNKTLKIIIRIFTTIFLILAVSSALHQGLHVLNFSTMTLSSILISITSFFFVADLRLMDDAAFSRNPFHQTNILLNTSLAAYYFVTILVFALTDYVYSTFQVEDARYVWASHNVIHIMKNFGIAASFYLAAKQSRMLSNAQKSSSTITV